MPSFARLAVCAAALTCLAGWPVAARAQPAASAARNGDERNGLDYQPTQAEVARRERADGLAPSPAQQQADTSTVERMYQKEMQREHEELGTPLPPEVKPVR